MKRQIIKIDENRCNGCGVCVPNCHEGAIQVIDGKLRLVSELMCDGLGACLGHCPQGAISIETREAETYNETLVISKMIPKGKNLVIAHLKHLKENRETTLLNEAFAYLKERQRELPFTLEDIKTAIEGSSLKVLQRQSFQCPSSIEREFNGEKQISLSPNNDLPSALSQWPIQFHLINPSASYFHNADLIIAADCVAFSLGSFHAKYLPNKRLIIGCPKLDSNQDLYSSKLITLIENANINTITVMIMEVPCCSGLAQMVVNAATKASRKVPVKIIIVGLQGDILKDEWIP